MLQIFEFACVSYVGNVTSLQINTEESDLLYQILAVHDQHLILLSL